MDNYANYGMQPKKNAVKTRPTFQKLHKINAQTMFEKANRIVVIYKKHTIFFAIYYSKSYFLRW